MPPPLWNPNEKVFSTNFILTSHIAILGSTQNGKTRKINIGDMYLADPTTLIEAEDIPQTGGAENQNYHLMKSPCQT